ncbi:MAG: glutamine--tRNA ligase/YqeY domain fusion protein, partial [Candidatus Omnitrophota bacterium]
ETEEVEYVNSIMENVRWLGFNWQDRLYYASDYFSKLYDYAVQLIKQNKAFVCDQSLEEMRKCRGTITEPGTDSPYRDRSVEENLDLFARMKTGEFAEGTRVLRGKIDMGHPNLLLRDPVFYRIRKEPHHRTGNAWCIYPMYDFTHCICDSLEGITHSICTLEFEVHRPLYDWILDALSIHHPQQIEFARLNLSHTLLSKRKLLELVDKKLVNGWDDPRMPTLAGFKRRGYTPGSIRKFCEQIGVAKADSIIDMVVLENCIREELNKTVPRVMAVLRPLKVIIDNYPLGQTEEVEAVNNPEDASMGTRKLPFSRELYIDEDDFREDPPKQFYRLAPGREVRLRYAYFITCVSFSKDENGKISEIHCTYDPATRGGDAPDGRKVKATMHWVSCSHAINAEVRLYDTLFTTRNPNDAPEGSDFTVNLNPKSLQILQTCKTEPCLKNATAGQRYQFERLGYFAVDTVDSTAGKPVFNRTVTLRDMWAKIEKKTVANPSG